MARPASPDLRHPLNSSEDESTPPLPFRDKVFDHLSSQQEEFQLRWDEGVRSSKRPLESMSTQTPGDQTPINSDLVKSDSSPLFNSESFFKTNPEPIGFFSASLELLRSFSENPFEVNLYLTGLISKLLLFPSPSLREALLHSELFSFVLKVLAQSFVQAKSG